LLFCDFHCCLLLFSGCFGYFTLELLFASTNRFAQRECMNLLPLFALYRSKPEIHLGRCLSLLRWPDHILSRDNRARIPCSCQYSMGNICLCFLVRRQICRLCLGLDHLVLFLVVPNQDLPKCSLRSSSQDRFQEFHLAQEDEDPYHNQNTAKTFQSKDSAQVLLQEKLGRYP